MTLRMLVAGVAIGKPVRTGLLCFSGTCWRARVQVKCESFEGTTEAVRLQQADLPVFGGVGLMHDNGKRGTH